MKLSKIVRMVKYIIAILGLCIWLFFPTIAKEYEILGWIAFAIIAVLMAAESIIEYNEEGRALNDHHG